MTFAHVNGIDLYFEETGTGRPVLFLHGWGTSGRAWDAQVAGLARDHRVITVDWRGCGRSDHPATGNDMRGNVADILALIDVLGPERPVLVGSSIGATFALEAALAAPERVAGVISVDGPGYWPGQSMGEQLDGLLGAFATDRAATVAAWVPNWFGPAGTADMVGATVRQILDSGTAIDALFTEARDHDPRQALRALAVPAVFLHGRLDPEIPVEVSETLAALAPHGEVHIIENAGHMPHQEQPAATNDVLRAALRRMATDHGSSGHGSDSYGSRGRAVSGRR
ncbi:alpha/beta fold hydrolase [Streptomyces sp. NPDC048445]|uniref:alpha/beta fold hydrolase n=1 Tax=Streptomyces sp. NPDC048445 TaxID=3365553 RepID=UPI00371A8EC3